MPRRRNFEQEVIVSLFCIITCVALALSSTGSEWTRRVMDDVAGVLTFVERPAVFIMRQLSGARRWMRERHDLLVELERLREENRLLSLQSGENTTKQCMTTSHPSNRYPIIYRDPRVWWESLRISTGNDSFEPGSAVLDGADLVGIITSQENGSAWVRLITSSSFYVPVVLAETREIGVVTGDDEGGVWLRYLPSDGDYRVGMKVYTVLGSHLPAGLPVGVITDERRTLIPGVDEYRIKTGADLFRLQYLYAVGGGGA